MKICFGQKFLFSICIVIFVVLADASSFKPQSLIIFYYFFSDENRDINIHPDDDLKRQRIHYSGDQLYSNVSFIKISNKTNKNLINLLFSYGLENGA